MVEKIPGIVHHSFYASKFIGTTLRVIIPAYGSVTTLLDVMAGIPPEIVDEVIVVDEGRDEGVPAHVGGMKITLLQHSEKGYGNACRKALQYLRRWRGGTDIVVFLNAEHRYDPRDLLNIVAPVAEGEADLVTGLKLPVQRKKGREKKRPPLGDRLTFALIRGLYGVRYTGISSLQAIRFEKLKQLDLREKDEKWLAELQIKAAKQKLRCREVTVSSAEKGEQMAVKMDSVTGIKLFRTLLRYM